jgi:hypothetical protein
LAERWSWSEFVRDAAAAHEALSQLVNALTVKSHARRGVYLLQPTAFATRDSSVKHGRRQRRAHRLSALGFGHVSQVAQKSATVAPILRLLFEFAKKRVRQN